MQTKVLNPELYKYLMSCPLPLEGYIYIFILPYIIGDHKKGVKMTTPQIISKCFPIYPKLGVVIYYINMYKHAKNQAHISKIH